MNPTNKPFVISLQGEKFKLFFNLNSFSAFEDITGLFFLDFVVGLEEGIRSIVPAKDEKVDTRAAMQFLKKVSIKNLRAFIWSCLHTYDKDGEPQWPLTLPQLGARIDHTNIMEVVNVIMRGTQENLPEPKAAEQEVDEDRPRPPVNHSLQESGGTGSGLSADEILASAIEK